MITLEEVVQLSIRLLQRAEAAEAEMKRVTKILTALQAAKAPAPAPSATED